MSKNLGLIALGILIIAITGYVLHSGLLNKHSTENVLIDLSTQGDHLDDTSQGGKSDNPVFKKNQVATSLDRSRQHRDSQTVSPSFIPQNGSVAHENYEDGAKSRSLPPGMIRKNIPKEYLGDVDRFYEQLQKVEEQGIEEEENEMADPIFFSTIMPDMNFVLPHRPESFSPYSTRIFAAFASTTENMRNQSEVLVKWHKSNQEILLFQYVPIVPNANFNYVWKEKDYWDIGIYNVEIFKLEDNVKLLASGSYIVDRLDKFVGYVGTYPTPEQAFPESVFYGDDEVYLIFNHSNNTDWYLQLSIDRIESGEEILNEEIVLPASQNGLFRLRMKQSKDVMSLGSYLLQLSDGEYLVGRSRFFIDE